MILVGVGEDDGDYGQDNHINHDGDVDDSHFFSFLFFFFETDRRHSLWLQ